MSISTHSWKNFWIVFASGVGMFLSMAALIPVIPQVIRYTLMGSDIDVGWVMAMQAAGAILARIVSGSIMAKVGIRNTLFLGACLGVLGAASYFLPLGLLPLAMGRFIQGAGEGFVFPASLTWVSTNTAPSERGRFMGLMGVSMWAGSSFAPPIGAFVWHTWGLHAVWIFIFIMSFCGIFSCRFLPDDAPAVPGPFKILGIPRESYRAGTTLTFATIGFSAISTFATLYFTQSGWQYGSFCIALFGVGYVIMRVFAASSIDKNGPMKVLLVSVCTEIIGLALFAFGGHYAFALAGSLVTGLGLALVFPCLAVFALQGTAPARHGQILGWYAAAWDMSLMVGNLVLGTVAKSWGYTSVFTVSGLFGILSLLIFFMWPTPALGAANSKAT